MKSVLISIQPKWCELIASGKKTVEVRKTRPKIETPFKVYIYQTKKPVSVSFSGTGRHISEYEKTCCYNKRSGKVIGEFVCTRVDKIVNRGIHNNFDYCYNSLDVFGNDDIETEITAIKKSCISKEELNYYGMYSHCLYAWHISDLVIYDEPKELREFKTFCKDYFDGNSCEDCEYFIDGRGYEYDESDCGCDGLKPLKRPFQSWGYVEKG